MTPRNDANSRTVYSTEHGALCSTCGKSKASCVCRKQRAVPAGDGIVRVQRETKGRKGKGVTVITGLGLEPDGLRTLAKHLKQQCGTGGTVKNGTIEIQGDHRDTVVNTLSAQGYTVKRAGG